MRKDRLAAGARSATFAGGFGKGEGKGLVMSEKDRKAADADLKKIVIEKKTEPRKKFIPTEEVMLVRRAEVVQSGLLIADLSEKEKPAEGTVIERGPSVKFNIGDHVVFGKYAGTEFKLNGEVLLLMNISDILGTLEDEA